MIDIGRHMGGCVVRIFFAVCDTQMGGRGRGGEAEGGRRGERRGGKGRRGKGRATHRTEFKGREGKDMELRSSHGSSFGGLCASNRRRGGKG